MKNIKLYQINLFYGMGSTGKLVYDLSEVCVQNGFNVRVASRNSNINSDNFFCLSDFFSKNFHSLMSRITGLQGYYSKIKTRKLINDILAFEPDIIHLHNLHGHFINMKMLFEFLDSYKKPIIWTLHDCWAFTGNCAYYVIENCNKWQEECDNCPNIHKYPNSWFFDRSKKMYYDKKRLYSANLDLTIVTVSNWLKSEVEKSFLKQYPVYTIYNYINLDVYNILPVEKKERKILLSIASSWSESKGIYDLIDFSKKMSDEFQLILIGKIEKKYIRRLDCRKVNIVGEVNSIEEMAYYYNYADILISLSKEETFGMTVAEATACGTPSIALKTSGIEEVVPQPFGITIDKYDFDILMDSIKTIFQYDQIDLSHILRNYAENNYNKSMQCKKYIELYKDKIKL